MKRSLTAAILCALLPASQTTAEPGPDIARISTFSGGTFAGSTQLVIYADDRAKFINTQLSSHTSKVTWLEPRAGRYNEAYAIARRLITKHHAEAEEVCMDYGSDTVSIGQNGTEQSISALCPDEAILAAIASIMKIVTDDAN